MKKTLYAVRDVKVGYNAPFIEINDATAKRGFAMAVQSASGSVMSFAPSDFSLFKVGEFDSDCGMVIPFDPVYLACAADYIGSDS